MEDPRSKVPEMPTEKQDLISDEEMCNLLEEECTNAEGEQNLAAPALNVGCATGC